MKLYQPFRYKLKVIGSLPLGKKKRKKLKNLKKRKLREYKNRIPKKYVVYIKSEYWRQRKSKYYQEFGRKCAVCFSTNFIDLHHIVYGNYGFERDEHLVPLCKEHHAAFHSKIGVKGNMIVETHEFIDEERQLLEFPKFG